MRYGRSRQPTGYRVELVDRRADIPKRGKGLLALRRFDVNHADCPLPATANFAVDEPAEIGRHRDPLG